MDLKHKSEWPEIINIANFKELQYDQIILLLALRETEDGPIGVEFNRLDALSNDLEAQTRSMCNFIKEKEKEYSKYLVRTEGRDEIFDFIEYLSLSDRNSSEIKEYIQLIKKEFDGIPKENL